MRLVWLLLFPSLAYATVIPPLLNSPDSLDLPKNNIQEFVGSPDTQEKPKKQIPTRWGGRTLTQMKKEISGIETTVFLLAGGAWIKHDYITIRASRIEIIGKDALLGYLKGGVTIYDQKNGAVLKANRGIYKKIEEEVVMEGSPELKIKNNESEPTIARSRTIRRSLVESVTSMQGFVEIHNSQYTIIGDNAVIYEDEDRIDVPGKPMIFGTGLFMTGNSLEYSGNEDNVILKENPLVARNNGNPLPFEEDQETSAEQTPQTSFATANEIIFHNSEDDESYTGLFGEARIFSETGSMEADFIKSIGDDGEKALARNGIRIFDKKGGMVIRGNMMEYDREQGYSHITENPVVEFLDKDSGDIKTTLSAVELERFTEHEEIVARGDVMIEGKGYIARGAYATYFEEEEKIHLEGNPSLEKDSGRMYSGRIVIYPETGQLILSDGIHVEQNDK